MDNFFPLLNILNFYINFFFVDYVCVVQKKIVYNRIKFILREKSSENGSKFKMNLFLVFKPISNENSNIWKGRETQEKRYLIQIARH